MAYSRQKIVDIVTGWLGDKQGGAAHKEILALYNGAKPVPRGYTLKATDAWCAATWSAAAIKAGYTAIMPVECSCSALITLAKKMGIWVEDDAYVPKPGDAVLYDWNDRADYAQTDDRGVPDHVGTVVSVNAKTGSITVIEGNKSHAVGKRTIKANGRYIRGYICPKYDNAAPAQVTESKATKTVTEIAKEVLAGGWGNGDARKSALTAAGYDYVAVQAEVNRLSGGKAKAPAAKVSPLAGTYKVIPARGLNVRASAGGPITVAIPQNHQVKCDGTSSQQGGFTWLHISTVYNSTQYNGYCRSDFLSKI